jgi:acetyltransferase-like isoleucine patch superfamily enzyme
LESQHDIINQIYHSKNPVIKKIRSLAGKLLIPIVRPLITEVIISDIRVYGDRARLKISPKTDLLNTLFNTVSGFIEIGDYSFTGHNVCLLTGTHNYESLLDERMEDVPSNGRDIIIGKGVWIGSNAVILGPCVIGDHSVVGAGSVVLSGSNIPKGSVVAGVPAKVIRTINIPSIPSEK